jgi:hypothetical protein
MVGYWGLLAAELPEEPAAAFPEAAAAAERRVLEQGVAPAPA